MAAKRKKRGLGYALFLIIYIALVLFAAYKVLSVVWKLAEEYENSRIAPVIDSYVEHLAENLDSSFAETVAAMEHPMQTDEECIAIAKKMLSSGITYKRLKSANAGRSVTYSLVCDNGTFGQVELHRDASKLPDDLITLDDVKIFQNEKLIASSSIIQGICSVQAWFTRDELTPWSVGESEFFFEGLYSSVQVTVPQSYPVFLNGHQLGPEYIVENGIHYDVLEQYYADYAGLPTKVTYKFDKIIGNMEPVIYDDAGNITTIDPNTDDSQFIRPCEDYEMDALRAFCENFMPLYVGYTSGKYKNEVEYGYGRVKGYIKSGSDIESRMKAAQDGIYYAHSPATVSSAWLSSAIRLTEGVYICNTGYTADAETPRGHEEVTVEMKLIVVDNNGDLRVVKEDR